MGHVRASDCAVEVCPGFSKEKTVRDDVGSVHFLIAHVGKWLMFAAMAAPECTSGPSCSCQKHK